VKISNNDRNLNTTSTQDRRPVSNADDSRKSSFAKTLERKREEREEEREEDSPVTTKDEPQTATEAAPSPYSQGQQQQEPFGRLNPEAGGAASQTEGAHASVAALASEIVEQIRVEIAPGDITSIEIDFNSKTLEGLKVRIESKDGKLGVHFTPPSEKVATLLSQNLATLSQNLTNQGYQLSVIDLKPMQAPRSEFEQQRGRDRDEGERGGRQGGQGESGGGGGGSDHSGDGQQGGHER
jgi:flagellar hook-length control protein FliK